MRIRWLSLIVLLLCAASVSAFERLDVTARFDLDSGRVVGEIRGDRISLPNAADKLHLRLYANRACSDTIDTTDNEWCGIQVDSIFINGHDYTDAGEISRTDLTFPLQKRDQLDSISYRAVFRVQLPQGRDRFGRDSGRFRLECWLPVPSPRADSGWLIENYSSAYAEPTGDLFNYRAKLTLPDTFQVVGAGIAEVASVDDNRQLISIGLDSALDIPLLVWTGLRHDSAQVVGATRTIHYHEADAWAIDSIAAWTDYALEYMSREVMPYPFDEFVVVVGGLSGGGALELPRMIWLPDSPDAILTGWPRVMVMHEVIHQWFYGIIASDQARHPWMDESITQYFTMRMNEDYGGARGDLIDYFGIQADYAMALRFQSKSAFDFAPINRAAGEYEPGAYFSAVYWKGSQVLETLTGLMGSDGERAFWREYVSTFAFSRPEPGDFFEIASKYLPADDPGLAQRVIEVTVEPDFVLREVTSRRAEIVRDDTDSSTSDTELYENEIDYAVHHPLATTVPLQIRFDDGSVLDTTVTSEPGIHTVLFERDRRVVMAVTDPDTIYAIDENLMNNSLSVDRESFAGLRLWSGLTFLVESLYSMVWGW